MVCGTDYLDEGAGRTTVVRTARFAASNDMIHLHPQSPKTPHCPRRRRHESEKAELFSCAWDTRISAYVVPQYAAWSYVWRLPLQVTAYTSLQSTDLYDEGSFGDKSLDLP